MKIAPDRVIEVLSEAFSPQRCVASLTADGGYRFRVEWFDHEGKPIDLPELRLLEDYLTRPMATDGCRLEGFVFKVIEILKENGYWVPEWAPPEDLCPKEQIPPEDL